MFPSMFADLYKLLSKYTLWTTLPRVVPLMMMFGSCVMGDGSAVRYVNAVLVALTDSPKS